MSNTHTPGPWIYQYTRNGHTVRQAPDSFHSLMVVNHAENPEADGRLMAAAPELLEALQLLLHEVDESAIASAKDYGWPVAISKSRAALAKATGEAS